MTRVQRQTIYLETFQKLKDQIEDKIPRELRDVWLGGASTMCLALAQMDDEVTEITYTLMLEFFQQACEEI